MCSICLKSPCDARCPNADSTIPVTVCSECGAGIYEGDKYFDSGNKKICEECMGWMSVAELLSILGEELKTA